MNPNDMQDILEMQRQAAVLARHSEFLGYTAYAALLICAIFSVLIFWKLCQIKALLQSSAQTYPTKQTAQTTFQSSPFAAKSTPPHADDDSRFVPKS